VKRVPHFLGVSKKSKQSIFAVLAQGAAFADPAGKKSIPAKIFGTRWVLAMTVLVFQLE
jgi:hypothetical protein